MYKQTIRLLTFLLFVVFGINEGQTQEKLQSSFSLDEIIAYSLENNTSILNAELDVLASKKKVWETTAIGLPQVSAKVAYQDIFKVPVMNFGGEDIDLGVRQNTTADLTVSQLIFNGSYIVGLQASRTYKLLSEQGLVKSEFDVKELVSNSYYSCLVLEENMKNLDEIISNQRNTQKEIRALFEAGFVEESDADQVDLILNNLENTKTSFQRQVDLSYLLLKLQTGIPIDHDLKLKDSLDDVLGSIDIGETESESFNPDNNIDYKLLLTQERLSELSLKNVKAEFLPSVSLFFNHQERLKKPDFDFSSPDILGINLEIPLFSSGQRLAKVSQAGIELEQLRNSRQEAYDGMKVNFMKNKSDFLTAKDKYLNEKGNMILAKKIYEKTLIKYQNGLVGSLDLTQAQSQFLNTQSNYFNAIYDLLRANTSLYKLLGKL